MTSPLNMPKRRTDHAATVTPQAEHNQAPALPEKATAAAHDISVDAGAAEARNPSNV